MRPLFPLIILLLLGLPFLNFGQAVDPATVRKRAEFFFYSNPDSALFLAKKAVELAIEMDRDTDLAMGLSDLAKISYIRGDYYASLDATSRTMAISKRIGFSPGLANAYNMRGLVFLGQERYSEALSEFRQAIAYNIELKDSTRLDANYFNLGLCYDELGRFNDAMRELDRASSIATACHDWHIVLMSLNRKGEANYHKRNYGQAMRFYQAALNYKHYQDDWERSFTMAGMAQTLCATGKYEQGLQYAQSSYQLAQKLNTTWDSWRAATILSECFASLGQFEKAYLYQRRTQQLDDSLRSQRKERELNYLHYKEQEAENGQLLRDNAANRKIIGGVTLFALLVSGLLIYLKRTKSHLNRLHRALKESYSAITLQNEELEFHRKQLLASNRTKDQVLTVIGHDLRSPFATVQQSIGLIRSGDLEQEEQQTVLESFEKQLIRVNRLLNELLAWASSQQGGAKLNKEPLDLSAVAEEVLEAYTAAIEGKALSLIHENSANLQVLADLPRLKIILQNLIGNAIKFTPRGGTITIKYSVKDSFRAIHILDTGKGMSRKKQELLFNSSGQAISEPGTENEAGSGLGLLLIQEFIRENGGKIKVISDPGKGSEFIVFFCAP